MHVKTSVFCCALLVYCAGAGFAQSSFGSVDHDKAEAETVIDEGKGFTAQVDIDTNLFQMTQAGFSDAKERQDRTDYFLIDNYPLGGFNVLDDTNVAFGYNGDWYGGNLSLNKDGLGGVKAWLGFFNNKLKITGGNDIGYGYADSQGADAGLRVYDDNVRIGRTGADDPSIDTSKNPDNITQDKGLLIELDLDPLKIAVAGGGNINDFAESIGSFKPALNPPDNDPIYGHSFQYGANIGYKIGELAKVNGSYVLQANKDKDKYRYDPKLGVVAFEPDAEIWTHLFGVYASVYPWSNDSLGITVGYAGVLIKYLDEYYETSDKSETAIPQILKNGINLTARYKTDKLTIKTDHNVSFWIDKNYRIYNLYKTEQDSLKNWGLFPKTNDSSNHSDVSHFFLWNGIGASYKFTPVIEGSIYARNLFRKDKTEEYDLVNNYTSLELKSTFHFSPNVEAYAGVTWQYTTRTASEGLTKGSGEFGANAPGETHDFQSMIQIPVGFTVKLQ
jgi:predicted porin